MTRDEISALLPFLINETLEPEERAEVMAAVSSDPALEAEVEALRGIRESMQNEDTFSPGEMGLARLMRDIKSEFATLQVASAKRSFIWPAIAATLLAVVLGQGVFQMQTDNSGGYQLAGDEDAAIVVIFQPEATEQSIRALMLSAGVEIVSGPSALGRYGLELVEDAAIDEVLNSLKGSDIIKNVDVPDE